MKKIKLNKNVSAVELERFSEIRLVVPAEHRDVVMIYVLDEDGDYFVLNKKGMIRWSSGEKLEYQNWEKMNELIFNITKGYFEPEDRDSLPAIPMTEDDVEIEAEFKRLFAECPPDDDLSKGEYAYYVASLRDKAFENVKHKPLKFERRSTVNLMQTLQILREETKIVEETYADATVDDYIDAVINKRVISRPAFAKSFKTKNTEFQITPN